MFYYYFSLAPSKVNLWRYKDPVLGPRLIPNYLHVTENSVMLAKETIFSLNMENKTIEFNDYKLSKQPLGNTIIYIVE